jgi:hypothetical protein
MTTNVSNSTSDLISHGNILFLGTSITIALDEGGEELSLEIVVDKTVVGPTPQLSFNGISETSAQFIFKGPFGPLGSVYNVPVGSIAGRKLTADFRIGILSNTVDFTYSFWAERI